MITSWDFESQFGYVQLLEENIEVNFFCLYYV